MANDFWSDPVNSEVAQFLGRSVMDAIRFQSKVAALEAENTILRAEVTRERAARQSVESECAHLREQAAPRGKRSLKG